MYKLNGEDIVPRLKVYNPDTRRTTGQFDDYKHKIDDYNPDFLEALGELADLYEEEDDFRADAFNAAITALEGQVITCVEDIKLFKLAELKGVGKATLEMYNEFIVTGKIKRLEEMRPKITKEEWDAFIENHEPLRHYEHKEKFYVGMFPEDEGEYEVWVTCIYHERSLKQELEAIIEKNSEEYDDDLRWALTGNDRTYNHETKEYEPRNPDYTIVYDIPKLKRCTEKFEFSEGDVHEEYIFEGYLIKNGTKIHTHPFKMGFSSETNAYKEGTVEALGKYGWTPPDFSEYLHEQLDLGGGWEDRVQEWKKACASPPPSQAEEKEEETGKRFWLLADTDVRKAVAQLPEDIKLTIDGEGKLLLNDGDRDQYIGRGCPFTFEYEGDTYEVDGTSETTDYGGIPQGLTFEGTLTKNGKQSCEISMEDEVNRSDIVEHNVCVTHGDFEKLGFVDGSEEEQAFIEQLKEELEENVVGAYDFPSGHE
jgi:hypothetical protein